MCICMHTHTHTRVYIHIHKRAYTDSTLVPTLSTTPVLFKWKVKRRYSDASGTGLWTQFDFALLKVMDALSNAQHLCLS